MGKRRFDSRNKKKKRITREEEGGLRISHLWSAAHLLAEKSPTLSRFYVSTTRQICRRINLTCDSVSMKRLICKKCNSLLISGLPYGCKIRHISKREGHIRVVCGNCGHVRRFPSRYIENITQKEKQEVNTEEKQDTDIVMNECLQQKSGGIAQRLKSSRESDKNVDETKNMKIDQQEKQKPSHIKQGCVIS